MNNELKDHIESNVSKGCWIWMGYKNKLGYGQINIDGKPRGVHRILYEIVHGKIPDGMCALHKCDVPSCVNPDHIFIGTKALNSADMVLKKRSTYGEKNARAKITELDVKTIRFFKGSNQKILGKIYGISQTNISTIMCGKSWRKT